MVCSCQIKQTNPPVSLSKIDEVLYEHLIYHIIDLADPDVKIPREIVE